MASSYRFFLLPLAFFALVTPACEDRHKATDGSTFITIAGSWSGNFQVGSSTGSLAFQLTQNAHVVTGPYQIDSSTRTGTVQGTVNGNNTSMTLTPSPGCTGAISLSGGVQSSTMQIFLGGSDCNGSLANGTGTLTKAP